MSSGVRPASYAITGAGGYIGSALALSLRRRGYVVYELRHHITADEGNEFVRPYTLEQVPRTEQFAGVDTLVHCAHDFRWTEWSDIERVNVRGAVRLFEVARAAGAKRLIFMSTLSAFPGCRSSYGRAKLEIEAAVIRLGGVVVRPGLVWGGTTGGMVGNLRAALTRSRIMPLIGRGQSIFYLVHINDLCRMVEEIARHERVEASQGPVVAAAETGMAFVDILRTLAQSVGRRVLFVPMPWRAVWLALRLAERLGFRPTFRSDSVLGLVYAAPPPDFAAARSYPVEFRDFTADAITSSCAAS